MTMKAEAYTGSQLERMFKEGIKGTTGKPPMNLVVSQPVVEDVDRKWVPPFLARQLDWSLRAENPKTTASHVRFLLVSSFCLQPSSALADCLAKRRRRMDSERPRAKPSRIY